MRLKTTGLAQLKRLVYLPTWGYSWADLYRYCQASDGNPDASERRSSGVTCLGGKAAFLPGSSIPEWHRLV